MLILACDPVKLRPSITKQTAGPITHTNGKTLESGN